MSKTMKTTPVHIAQEEFTATIDGETFIVEEGERVAEGHALVRRYGQHFKERSLREELQIRSACVAHHREEATRTASSEPLSRAGRAEREETRFWSSTVQLLERTAPDRPSSEQRREQDFFSQALDQIENSTAAELADVNAEAVRAFGFDRGWSRRVAD